MVEFSRDDNLFYCLNRLHSIGKDRVLPSKFIFNIFCDFKIEWSGSGKSSHQSSISESPPKEQILDKIISKSVTSDDILTTSEIAGTLSQDFINAIELLHILHESFTRIGGNGLKREIWQNSSLYRKLGVQLEDVLAVTSGTYPKWCDILTQKVKTCIYDCDITCHLIFNLLLVQVPFSVRISI